MPTFEIQGPDGQTYEIEAPDENAAVQALGQIGAQPPGQPAPAMMSPKGDFQPLGQGAILHGQTPDNQMVEYGRPNAVESALYGAADFGSFGTWDEITAAIDSMLGGDYDRTLEHARMPAPAPQPLTQFAPSSIQGSAKGDAANVSPSSRAQAIRIWPCVVFEDAGRPAIQGPTPGPPFHPIRLARTSALAFIFS